MKIRRPACTIDLFDRIMLWVILRPFYFLGQVIEWFIESRAYHKFLDLYFTFCSKEYKRRKRRWKTRKL